MSTVALMATIPERKNTLPRVIESLYGQVDRLVVWANGYDDVPPPCREPWIYTYLGKDMAALGKLAPLFRENDVGLVEMGDVVLTVDDDILYPRDYAARMRANVAALGGIVAVHGTAYELPARKLLGPRTVWPFTGACDEARPVHVVGTGTAAFQVSPPLPFVAEDFSSPYLVDLGLSAQCERRGVQRHVVARREGWLKPLRPEEGPELRLRRDLDGMRDELVSSVKWSRLSGK